MHPGLTSSFSLTPLFLFPDSFQISSAPPWPELACLHVCHVSGRRGLPRTPAKQEIFASPVRGCCCSCCCCCRTDVMYLPVSLKCCLLRHCVQCTSGLSAQHPAFCLLSSTHLSTACIPSSASPHHWSSNSPVCVLSLAAIHGDQ